ncbi:RNA polymerase-associated protein LEO1 [Coccidioides immitis RS]|uniref:RNA polymerase-associated protein LEO1 n=1 Tax=Coccidioides immitis (strain RS) TaxID=246410 RepID=A0A0E1RXV5_COCIM|nr:RNA polymerase-associated protein LEO1 [Coccidioides immitis RS]EAS31670.1 RNA polymerase-associated protein LEO1 [Coccidioides immitis RS]
MSSGGDSPKVDEDEVRDTIENASLPGEDSPPSLEEDKPDLDNDDADLFGSGSEGGDDSREKPRRRLDDEELDSGDDEGRWDRRESPMDEDGAEFGETLNIMDLNLGRTTEPESTDGQFYTLNMPNFLSIESEDFNPETYVAPPFSSASTSLCWRYDPKNGKDIQSNARIIRWSDGSLTLQLASNPTEQYRMPLKPLGRPNNSSKNADYDSELDSHVYLGAAAEASSVIRITSHLTGQLSVLPTTVETDDAVQKLQESLAAATRTGRKNPDGTVAMFDVKEDPELAKKQAEQAEREKLREARRRQLAADRDLDRGRRVGLPGRTGGAGLTIAGLEGDDMLATRGRIAKKPRRKPNRRGEIYTDDEEEYGRRGRTREDEYDEDDGFLVRSDEEIEIEEEEEEELLEEDDNLEAEGETDDEISAPHKMATREKEKSPRRPLEDGEEPEGAKAGTPPVRKKNRYVVESDEDE